VWPAPVGVLLLEQVRDPARDRLRCALARIDQLQAIVPPDTFYILAEAAKHYPVEALAYYLTAVW
jgi:hypothetical protein